MRKITLIVLCVFCIVVSHNINAQVIIDEEINISPGYMFKEVKKVLSTSEEQREYGVTNKDKLPGYYRTFFKLMDDEYAYARISVVENNMTSNWAVVGFIVHYGVFYEIEQIFPAIIFYHGHLIWGEMVSSHV